MGTAKGLSYLHEEHEPCMVHRDIKASNVLLGRNYSPKIGDFGLAKLFPDNVTHVTTRVVGTTGYLAPEYVVHGQLTKKADVYSFGVLLLKVISGRRVSETIRSDTFLVRQCRHGCCTSREGRWTSWTPVSRTTRRQRCSDTSR
ncbi:hypothetical protein ACQJBY_058788 [Aegilops geniculata]